MSQGQRVRLGLVLALGRRAPAYILDDPFLGLDPVARVTTERFIAMRAEEAAMLVAAQDTSALERLCTDLLLLRDGRALVHSSVEAWRDRFRALRVLNLAEPLEPRGFRVLRSVTRGAATERLLDDPSRSAESILLDRGARIHPLPLRLDELLSALVEAA